jgi:hypothetical protein
MYLRLHSLAASWDLAKAHLEASREGYCSSALSAASHAIRRACHAGSV